MRVHLVLLLTAFVVSACAKKGNNTRDENGNCTSEYVHDHNELSTHLNSANWDCNKSLLSSASRCESSASSVLASCATYQAHHPAGRTCTAFSYQEGHDIRVSTTPIHDACNTLRAAMNSATTTTTTVTTSPTPPTTTEPAIITSPQDARSKYHLSSDVKFASEFPSCEEIKYQSQTMKTRTLSEMVSASIALIMEQVSALEAAKQDINKYDYLSAEQKKLDKLIECVQKTSNSRAI
jgi:hypothetical protein